MLLMMTNLLVLFSKPCGLTNATYVQRRLHLGCPGGTGDESAPYRHSPGSIPAANTTIYPANRIVLSALGRHSD
eukprot:387637-Prymnesium_polylepis.1